MKGYVTQGGMQVPCIMKLAGRMAKDPGEFNDLAAKYPDKLKALADAWDKYAADNGVVEPNRPVGYAKPPRAGSY